MARDSTAATNAATNTPQKSSDESTYPFDGLFASLSNQKKMAGECKAVVTPKREKKQMSEALGFEKEPGTQTKDEGGSAVNGNVQKPKKKNKKKKQDKQKSQEATGVNGATRRTTLTKGDRERLRREEEKRLALAVSEGQSVFGGAAADAETNGRMESDVKVDDDGGSLQISHDEDTSDSEIGKRKAHRGNRGGKAHRKDPRVAEELDAVIKGALPDDSMGDKIGPYMVATSQPGIDVLADDEGEQSVDEVERSPMGKEEKKDRKKKKKGKDKPHKKGRETLDRELDQYMSGEQDREASPAMDLDDEDSRVGGRVDLPERDSHLEATAAEDLEMPMESQSLESQIRAELSKSQKKKKRKREIEAEAAALNIEDSIIGYAGDVEMEDAEAEAEKKKNKKRKKEKKAKRYSQLQANDTESVEDGATQQSSFARVAIEEVVVQQKTPVRESLVPAPQPKPTAVPAPTPSSSTLFSHHGKSNNNGPQAEEKEKIFMLPASLMERATIRQEQQDELRNTIIRAKKATPVKPTVIAKPTIITKPRSPKFVKKEPESETSADEGPLMNYVSKPKESPVPLPRPRQLTSRPASRAPPSTPSFKKPIKARGGNSSDNDPLSRAVSTIRKDSLSKISGDMFNTAGASGSNKSGPSRRIVTSSALDSNEKLVLVEEPNWEAVTGKVRARIGGDDAEGEENIAFSSAYLKAHPEGIRVGNTHFSRIINVAPGSPYTFPAGVNETETNFCTIVGGQGAVITVGPAGEKTRKRFSMRVGGMWVVKRGMSCVVANATTDLVVLNVWSVWEA